jgi:Uncharacterized conserved protein (some members contain a von Willebrand factor type A (vWA) domain)
MSELFDSEFMKKLEKLVITSKVILEGNTIGNRKSHSKGSSVEFSDYREYASGDDFRRVDWNAYGRFEKLFIKLFMEEREAPVSIILDASKSMDWGEPNKSMASRRLAAALGFISLANFDRVMVAALSDRLENMKCNLRGRNSVKELLRFLENIRYENPTDMPKALKSLDMRGERGITILISDLFSNGMFREVLNYLRFRRQDIFVCHILSPNEIEPGLDESLRLIDSETAEYREVTASTQLIKAYKKAFDSFVAGIEEECFRAGAEYIRLDTAMQIEQMIKKVGRYS